MLSYAFYHKPHLQYWLQFHKTIYMSIQLRTIPNSSSSVVNLRNGKEDILPHWLQSYSERYRPSCPGFALWEHWSIIQKIFSQLLSQSSFNVFVVFQKATGNTKNIIFDLRIEVIKVIFQKYSYTLQGDAKTTRLVAHYFISHSPPPPNEIKKEPWRRCAVCCSKKDADDSLLLQITEEKIRTRCKDSNVGLCIESCFKI